MRMKGWARQIGAGIAALAMAAAQSSGQAQNPQVTNTPQGGLVLKMSGDLVLTNVVARDRRIRARTQAGRLQHLRKRQAAAAFDLRL